MPTYNTPVYREIGTGKFRVDGATQITYTPTSPTSLDAVIVAHNLIVSLLTSAGLGEDAASIGGSYSTAVYIEQGTGKIRVKGGAALAAYSDSPAVFADVATSLNGILGNLTLAGINPASGEDLSTVEAAYPTDVYREQNTGKIRAKGVSHVADVDDGGGADDGAAGVIAILALLDAVGLNPEA